MSFTKEQFLSLHRFSIEQYYELGELGLLDRRTKLLDGVIIDMEPVSPWHANIGDILSRIFNEGARGRFRVRVEGPPKNCDVTRWSQFTDIKDIKKRNVPAPRDSIREVAQSVTPRLGLSSRPWHVL